MALDATVGGPNANSYVTLDEAIAYFNNHPYGAAFIDEDQDLQEQLLIFATLNLDSLCWTGAATTEEQALAWPRIGMIGKNGYPVASDVLPKQLKIMTLEQARRLQVSNVAAPSDEFEQGIKRVKASTVEIEFRDDLTYSAVTTDVLTMGVPSWFCSTTAGTFMFEVL